MNVKMIDACKMGKRTIRTFFWILTKRAMDHGLAYLHGNCVAHASRRHSETKATYLKS